MTSHPPSDHCDGTRFFNPGHPRETRGLPDVLRWRLTSRRVPWPPPPPDPWDATATPAPGTVTAIGHATFLLRLPGLTVLTDPVFSDRVSPVTWAGPRRARPPGLALAALPPVDLILLSHNHYDHMDLPSLRQLHARGCRRVVTTLGNRAIVAAVGFPEVTELDWWKTCTAGAWTVTATPARHASRRGPGDANRSLWAGFMLTGPGAQVLFAGDSGSGPHWHAIRTRLGAPALALLPIGAYEPRWFMHPVHMNPAEAVDAHASLGARLSLAMHWGVFQLTDEAIDAPPLALTEALRGRGLPPFEVPGFGEPRALPQP